MRVICKIVLFSSIAIIWNSSISLERRFRHVHELLIELLFFSANLQFNFF